MTVRGRRRRPWSASASNGRSFQPFAVVFVPTAEPSKRMPLRNAVETLLTVNGYPQNMTPRIRSGER